MTWIDIGFSYNFLEPCADLHIPIDIQDKRHGQSHYGEYKDNNGVKKPLCSSNNGLHGSTTAFLRSFVYFQLGYKQPEWTIRPYNKYNKFNNELNQISFVIPILSAAFNCKTFVKLKNNLVISALYQLYSQPYVISA